MRIVGGKFAGRDLTSPTDRRVRPTAEHMRKALLDLLEPELAGARVLDLFAGTGALGIEAISRGALSCDFVEWRPTSLWALKSNINRFKLKERSRVFKHDAIRFAEAVEPGRYDVAFCDPPYESRQLDWVIRIWEEQRFSRLLAVEHAVVHLLPRGHSTITSGSTRFTIYRHPDAPAAPGAAGAPAPVALVVADPGETRPPGAPERGPSRSHATGRQSARRGASSGSASSDSASSDSASSGGSPARGASSGGTPARGTPARGAPNDDKAGRGGRGTGGRARRR